MRAVQVVDTSGLEGVRVVDVPPPALPDGGVLVDVRCAGLSFPDVLLSRGLYQVRPELPFTLGLEAAGVVREASPGSGFAPGDRVTAFSGVGACAEVMAALAPTVCRLPQALSFEEGAALTLNYHTAHFGLVRRGRLRAGETVLVQGAGGGVGSAAVQVATARDARVIAAVSSEAKAEVARRCGAAEVVSTHGPWREEVLRLTGGRGVEVVFDPVGGERFRDSLRCLAPEGRLVVIGFAEGSIPEVGANRVLFRNVDLVGAAWGAFLTVDPGLTRAIEADLAPLVEQGRIRPHVGSVLALEDAALGLAEIAERRALGKVVLRV